MSMYAIIQLAGKQFKVAEGETLTVDRLETSVQEDLKISDVLLVAKDNEIMIGEPLVKGAAVTLKVVDHGKGEKIRVAKFKSKSRYRKVQGHRQYQTTLEVVKISA
jgi:large subunit ribosomal protein L21